MKNTNFPSNIPQNKILLIDGDPIAYRCACTINETL